MCPDGKTSSEELALRISELSASYQSTFQQVSLPCAFIPNLVTTCLLYHWNWCVQFSQMIVFCQ